MAGSRAATRPGGWAVACLGCLAAAALLFLGPLEPARATASLQIVFTNPSYETLAVDAAGAAYGRPVGGSPEIWRSTDEGRNWTKQSSFPASSRLNYVTPLQSGTLLAAVDDGALHVFRSSDAGVTWSDVLTLPIKPCFYSTLTPHSIAEGDGYIFLGTYNNCPDGQNANYVYRSGDDGRTWSVVYTSTTHRHVHAVRFDSGTHALYVFYGDSTGGVERSTNDGASFSAICTVYANCVAADAAFGSGFALYGTDTPYQQNAIVRLDLGSGATTRVMNLPRVSYSALSLGGGRVLVGQVAEAGTPIGDGKVHLYASDDGGSTFGDVYSFPYTDTSVPHRLQVQFAYPNGDFPIQWLGGGTVVAHFGPSGTPSPPTETVPTIPSPPSPAPGGGSSGSSGGSSGGIAGDVTLALTADHATAVVGDTVTFRVVVTDANNGSAPDLKAHVSLPANGALVSTYAERGPGCRSTDATTLDCDLAYVSGDSRSTGLNVTLRKTATGPLKLTASASFLFADPTPADDSATLSVGDPTPQAPLRPPGCVVPRLQGLVFVAARVRATAAGCLIRAIRHVHNGRRAGRVLSQTPVPGTTIGDPGTVRVTVSLGPIVRRLHGRR